MMITIAILKAEMTAICNKNNTHSCTVCMISTTKNTIILLMQYEKINNKKMWPLEWTSRDVHQQQPFIPLSVQAYGGKNKIRRRTIAGAAKMISHLQVRSTMQ